MQEPSSARVTRRVLARVWSPQLENERDIDIFLPPSYAHTRRRYPTIYMQDGQNLADPERAFAGTWRLEEGLWTLAQRGLETIVVGVPNRGAERMREYSPFPDARHGGGGGDAYLAFIERTLKARRSASGQARRQATGIFGSSMGGLIGLCCSSAPETFGSRAP
jgi:predicted alpha/beta superfamily hydrolase